MGAFQKRKETLEKLFSLYRKPMYRYALKITKDPNMAEDAVQDAFCKMIKYIDSVYNEDDRTIKSYLFAVTKTCVVDALRKNKDSGVVTNPLENNVLYIEDSSDEDFNIDKVISEISFDGNIKELISNLKEEDQLILYLRYARDASDEEIADILNLNTAMAVRKRLSRARSRLRSLLDTNERE